MNFVAPVFLYGLAAISIPVIIHMVELRRARKILFTNVAFIKEVKNITASHRRLKQILILLARIGFIIFLVLLFAQPYLPNKEGLNKSNNIKIFIDNSLSMQNESEASENSLLETAVRHGENVVRAVGPNARFNYLDLSNLSNAYIDYTNTKITALLNQLDYTASSKSFNTILASLVNSQDDSYETIIYSDFQKNAFDNKSLQSLSKENPYYLVHLKGTAEHNIYIDSVYLEDEFIRLNQINRIRVKLRNGGNADVNNCNIKFYIGNEQVSALSVAVPAKQTTSFLLNYRLTDAAPKNCKIVLQDYPIEFDNTYYFSLQASPRINIIDVAEYSGTPTQRLYTNEPLFQYKQVTPSQFNYTLLKEANLVILNSLNNLTPAFADNLRTFVNNGGSIAFIPGSKINAIAYNQFLQNIGLGIVQTVGSAVENPQQTELAQPDRHNPFFRNIFETASARMEMPRSARLLTWSRAASDILKFRDGGKFLSVFNMGKGQTFLFAAPLQDTFSDFANHALFVPVMYKLAMQSYRNKQNIAYSFNTKNIRYPLTEENNKEVFKLVKDSVEYIPEQHIREGNLFISLPAEITEAGFYKLMSGKSTVANFAFNYNKKESELDFYSTAELKDLVGNAKNVRIIEASDEVAIKKLFSQDNLGTQLWKYCLILCLVFALTEILLIRFM